MSVFSKTELKDSDGDGTIALSDKTAKLLGVKPGSKLSSPGTKVEGGWSYELAGETPAQPPAPPKTVPDLPQAPQGDLVQKQANAFTPSSGKVLSNAFYTRGSIVLKTGGTVDEYTIQDVATTKVARLIQSNFGETFNKLRIERVRAENISPGNPFIGLRGAATDGISEIDIIDLYAAFVPEPNTQSGKIPTAVQGGGKGDYENIKRISITRAYIEGALSELSAKAYWNGDGLTFERALQLLELNDITVKNCVDSCLDSKARKNVINWFYGESAMGIVKLWDDSTVENMTLISPFKRGGTGGRCFLRLMGNNNRPGLFTFKNLKAHDAAGAPLITATNGAVEFHGTGSFDGEKLFSKDKGGYLVPGSTWNGEVIA